MQRAIGCAVCLVMVATSIPAFADDETPAESDEQATSTDVSATADAGSGGREPMPQVDPMAPSGGADAAAQAAHEEFVAHIWNSP